MNWIPLESKKQVDKIIQKSQEIPCVIFKHSTRCSISTMAKMRLEGDWDISNNDIESYYLDLIAFRDVSNYIAEVFKVHHESPQLLLIKNGDCTYENSHLDITVSDLKESLPA